jgi:hypothetical protein
MIDPLSPFSSPVQAEDVTGTQDKTREAGSQAQLENGTITAY